ncbi:hypothetical protein Cri9333_0377 [Crinalium epipsammum PCC 9333]|uniref:Uncharacterized protein n=1 Tax=Crinalium epipsammum PCC 9333 TaxID=1173022 RepID=K9VV35_9CYAN|nr:hypothetical protein [Crinalium epipsammum]AFZ11352.1 hypothetical protein Cri9333_0377 [Crinalium epipsammum PCC 9333]
MSDVDADEELYIDAHEEICQTIQVFLDDNDLTTTEVLDKYLSSCGFYNIKRCLKNAERDGLIYQLKDGTWHLTIKGLEEFCCSPLFSIHEPVNRY